MIAGIDLYDGYDAYEYLKNLKVLLGGGKRLCTVDDAITAAEKCERPDVVEILNSIQGVSYLEHIKPRILKDISILLSDRSVYLKGWTNLVGFLGHTSQDINIHNDLCKRYHKTKGQLLVEKIAKKTELTLKDIFGVIKNLEMDDFPPFICKEMNIDIICNEMNIDVNVAGPSS